MHTHGSDAGFTITELLIASLITLVVVGVAFTTFDNALALNQASIELADANQNLRAGINQLVRDLLQAGRNVPIGGIAIPSGAGASAIQRPSPPGLSYTFDNTTDTTLKAITTGAGLGPSISGLATDMITILMDDPYLGPLESVQPSGTAGSDPELAADGSYIDIGSQTAWMAGDALNGIPPITAGDLLYFSTNGGTALQSVTSVTASRINFGAGDPFNLNQPGAAAGSITQILGAPMTVRRVLMITYYVYEDTPGVPRLFRVLNQFPPTALAGVVEDLDLTFDLVDGVNNPTEVEDLPYSDFGVTFTSSQIRKVNVHVGVRSERPSTRTGEYLRSHVSSVVSLRNLAYVDRYQ
jgi:hypothetical protein